MIGEHTYKKGGVIPEWVEVGRYSQIAEGVTFLINEQHPSVMNRKIVANYPFANKFGGIKNYPLCGSKNMTTTIGNDVWIGKNVLFIDGVRVGNGAIIGANAVVTKDVPAYAVVVGNPSIIKRYRFTESQIEALEKIRWWEWEKGTIIERLQDFLDIEEFIKKYA